MTKQIDMVKRLKRALRQGGDCFAVEDIAAAINRGEMQCFHKHNAFVVTEIGSTPRKKFMSIVALCGELSQVMSLQDDIIDCARKHDCSFIFSAGRVGWDKVLPSYGWAKTGIVHIYDLGGYHG